MNPKSIATALLALALVQTTHAAPQTIDVWLKADITITADGSIESLQWQEDARPGVQLLHRRAEPVVRLWQFVPGQVDGVPARTQTHLLMQVLVLVDADGSAAMKFGSASTGGRSLVQAAPRYPPNAARAGASATLVAEISVDTNGVSTLETLTFQPKRSYFRSDFIAAAEAAIKSWTFQPERVAGRPVATRLRIPIEFCSDDDNWCARQDKKRLSAMSDALAPPGEAVPLTSVVKLITQVNGQVL